MKRWMMGIIAAMTVIAGSSTAAGEKEPVAWVDPFLGTGETALPPAAGIAARWSWLKPRHGQLHPGATSPFGLVSVVPYGGGYPTGYWRGIEGRPCSGFTHFQQSGTGAIGRYYNYVRVAPVRGDLTLARPAYVLTDESASPGVYRANLSPGRTSAAITVTAHATFHRYDFDGARPSHLVIDLAQAYDGRNAKHVAHPTAAEFKLTSPRAAEASIVIDGLPLHLCLEVDGPVDEAGGWAGAAVTPGTGPFGLSDGPFGIWFSFAPGTETARVKIGFSFKSVAQARASLAREMPGWDFEAVAAATRREWSRHLDRFRVEGGTPEDRTLFHTALYRALIKPADATGENSFWESDLPWYVDFATLWDTYKTQSPLLMTFYPERGRDVANALLNIAGHHGRFPVGYLLPDTLGFDDQGIDFAQMIIADAHAKGVQGIDWPRALPLLVGDLRTSGHYADTALHCAYASACLVPIAQRYGNPALVAALRARAAGWRSAFDPATLKLPARPGAAPGYSLYEGGVWNYSFSVWHDPAGLVAMYPTKDDFVHELDRFFGFADTVGVDIPFEGLNNQPDMDVPYAYLSAGRPDRTQAVVHAVRQYRFGLGRGGWPGNDDSGGTAAWYVWNALGLFPLVGQDYYLIGTPLFSRVTMKLASGRFEIEARDVSPDSFYVQSATLNGRPLERPYLFHHELAAGGKMVLQMGPRPSVWGRTGLPPPVHQSDGRPSSGRRTLSDRIGEVPNRP